MILLTQTCANYQCRPLVYQSPGSMFWSWTATLKALTTTDIIWLHRIIWLSWPYPLRMTIIIVSNCLLASVLCTTSSAIGRLSLSKDVSAQLTLNSAIAVYTYILDAKQAKSLPIAWWYHYKICILQSKIVRYGAFSLHDSPRERSPLSLFSAAMSPSLRL